MEHPLPESFLQRLSQQFPEAAEKIEQAMHGVPRTAINHHRKKFPRNNTENAIPWNDQGAYVSEDKVFALDPLWHAGAYYVMEPASQSLASMLQLLNLKEGSWKVLDLCAAPGGKSSVIMNALNDESLLVSNEIHRQRAQILHENAVKWGRAHHLVTNATPDDLADSAVKFDLIVIDAPCSGEGMFRKDHNARAEWSEANVQMCAERQEDILASAKRMLADEGVIIYSTCTLASAENDLQLHHLISSGEFELLEGVKALSFSNFGALQTEYGWQFAPGLTESEGLYISAIRSSQTGISESPIKQRYKVWKGEESSFTEQFDSESIYDVKGNPRFIPNETLSVLEGLQQARVAVLKAGIGIGRMKGKHLLPDHELAMWEDFSKLELIDRNLDSALDYLRCQSGREDLEKGWKCFGYQNQAIGWVKSIGNRWNNHYPEKWKLRLR